MNKPHVSTTELSAMSNKKISDPGPFRDENFRPLVQFLLGVPVAEVIGQSSNENIAPAEDFGWSAHKVAREIEVEKIKALFR